MTEEQERAVRTLIEGLAHFDGYSPMPSDDTAVYAEDSGLYEFAAETGRLTVGHLRDIASIFTQEN